MSLALKLSSLVIRTLSKPIANQIKAQAREHERFRRMCISMAQGLHRLDMRLRLGVIRDSAASERRAAAEAAARKHKPTSPTVKTEAETRAQEAADSKAKAAAAAESTPRKYHIRPLSESKAIESGATFISEAFLFLVAGGLVVFESWRSRRKETTRRDDVETRLTDLEQSEKSARTALVSLEKELLRLREKHGESTKSASRILPPDMLVGEEEEEETKQEGWWSRIAAYLSFGQSTEKASASTSEATQPSPDVKSLSDNKSPVPPEGPSGNEKPSES
ncbi:OPA3 domain protein [Aspergillus sclerotialis]|uniref:OPA3 domain protein n=1 Tax=Aspergillus sclerotialis TaxID=2070753 RepID=A0A3A2ZW35_9EURO|nr:OPA3 domain protein [Aspergillus sclerotialis]